MSEPNKHAAVAAEARALFVGSAGFVLLGGVAFLLLGREPVALSGRGSAGDISAMGTAVLSAGAVVAGSLQRRAPRSAQFRKSGGARRVIDIAGLALAHACIFLLGWLALFWIFQQAFIGAVLYPVSAAVLIGTTGAVSAYAAYLSALGMTAYRLAALLAGFLVIGILTSMLTAADPQWWQKNLSALGMNSGISAVAFNFTLIVAGVVVTTLAGYSTTTLAAAATTPSELRRVGRLERGLILMGIFLACVGLFPVDERFGLHTLVASGMVVVFASLIVRIRTLVPSVSSTFAALGWVFLAVILAAAVLWFPVGYYNLTAVELIAASLIFAWLIVLIRNLAAVDADLLSVDQSGVDRSSDQPDVPDVERPARPLT